MLSLQVISVLLAAVSMSMALAHALEYPGKMRLSREKLRHDTIDLLPGIYSWGHRRGSLGPVSSRTDRADATRQCVFLVVFCRFSRSRDDARGVLGGDATSESLLGC